MPFSVLRTAARGLAVLALIVGCFVATGTSANADPSRPPGCTSKSVKQRYAVGGVTFYGQERSVRFCWTGGPVLQSKIYSVSGDAYCWANFSNQERNCVGPTDRNKVRISISQRFGRGYATVYFWFQSRGCATGPINLICSGWKWHGAKYHLKQGGSMVLVDADV